MAFDRKLLRYIGRPIETRYDNIRNPDYRPQIRVQALDPVNCGDYGPIQICFDLKNLRDPKKSKPLAFANLKPGHAILLAAELIKAAISISVILKPEDIIHQVVEETKIWYMRNYNKINYFNEVIQG